MSRTRSEISDAEWAVWREFYVMRRQLDRALEQRLQSKSGISAPEYEVLFALISTPERRLRSRELGDLIGWEKSRISHQVRRMVSRGLVERTECDTDLRGTWITLTSEGRRAALDAIRGHNAAVREYFFDVLSDEEIASIAAASRRVLDAINPPICETLAETD